ncbi:hypothetical protein [Tepidibacillus marianensis]|uniref:hypothetical protein n=1 Tax=Tepidibacillus marianensis TaxID=3131995 RepID=UPI0030CB2400
MLSFFLFLTWLIKWIYLTFSKTEPKIHVGKHIEISTTVEEDKELFDEIYQTENQIIEQNPSPSDFQPLEFEKISTDNKTIEQIAKGVRSWSQDD